MEQKRKKRQKREIKFNAIKTKGREKDVNMIINKDELARRIKKKSRVTQWQTLLVLEALQEVIAEALIQGDKVQITNFLTFENVQFNRTSYTMPDKTKVKTEPTKRVRVRVSDNFKSVINSET